ncbi:hypothetical protein FHR99_001177 [Litorivivens lipolytica]|uniref:Uncharacterized protein n=1 Tax=Litorivivens lipolytica TaxID=1524264 RepID=A0A7W4W3U7_9GAMM|nr:hypothetical protein [Litorivivens lipolytica]MBB3046941.1 hypothetical protein [Litorivivens lipolytica]
MYARFFLLLAMFAALPASACNLSASTLVARYTVSHTNGDSHPLVLWRANHQVVQQRPDRGISDYWQWLRNGSFTHTRYFEHFARGVEMPLQLDEWSPRWQLLSSEALEKMTLQSQKGDGCKLTQKYHRPLPGGDLTVWWNPYLKLVVLLNRQKSGESTTMKLVDFDTDSKVVSEFIADLQELPTRPLAEIQKEARFIDAVLDRGVN